MMPLQNRVALVAGATRGTGRGITLGLAEQGATVYCTGRSVRGRPATGNRPETIEETAEMVDARGGKGIAVQVDHTRPEQVRALVERIEAEHGRLDVLVNDIWGGDELTEWGKPLWEHSLEKGLLMQQRAVHTHIITNHHALPLMIRSGRGLVVEVTDGISPAYRGNVFYDLAKVSVIRLAQALAYELLPHGITALAVTPGFLRSEAMLDLFGVTEANWQDHAKKDPHFAESETPLFVGRGVAALAADPKVWSKSGGVFTSWGLSDEYGIIDADGRRPHWGRYMAQAVDERWPRYVKRVGDELREHGLDPRTVLDHERETLTLRGRLNPGSEEAEWVTRVVLEPELFMTDPEKLAKRFYEQYERAR
jgi:NAD(P)-dependent dehydrogenase (short-subunit alcohol dehydrogenase family)